jgi:HD-GYP domain-containing protein (c-di-GMP phosphodiesterase class II)
MDVGVSQPPSGTLATTLIVDDDPEVLQVLSDCLSMEPDLTVLTASSLEEADVWLSSRRIDVLLADLYLGGEASGVDVIRRGKELFPDLCSILITGYPTLETAISVLKLGASDYFIKPFEIEALRGAIHRGIERLRLTRDNMQLREQVAISRLMQAVSSTIELDEILEMVIGTALRELSADAASILLRNDITGELELRGLDGKIIGESDAGFLYGRDETTDTVVQSARPKIINCTQIDMFDSQSNSGHDQVYISHPLLAKGQVIGVFNLVRSSRVRAVTEGTFRSAGMVAGQAAVAIENARLYKNIHGAYLDTIAALANAIEIRDSYTRGHTDRVKLTAESIARRIGWEDDRLFDLWMGCTLHDIGKIGVPDSILNKPDDLNPDEFLKMKAHPVIGAKIIEGIPFLEPALPYILYHHERWDGKGYPHGLKGAAIPVEGRILAVADTFDAIISDRPYRKGRSVDMAIEELKSQAGTQFDPEIVRIFVELLVEHNMVWLLHRQDA